MIIKPMGGDWKKSASPAGDVRHQPQGTVKELLVADRRR
jgi:hypothetical protein